MSKRQKMPPVPADEVRNAQKWHEKIKFQKHLVIDGDSYNQWVRELMPIVNDMSVDDVMPIGKDFVLRLREFPTYIWESIYSSMPFVMFPSPKSFRWQRATLSTAQNTKRGQICFTKPIQMPILTTPGNLDKPWMSLSPLEIFTQRPAIRKAKGDVLMGGLGMGWLARRVAEKKGVNKVTVVEQNKDVAEFFGKMLSDLDNVEILVDDAYLYAEAQVHDYDAILFDIWKSYCESSYDTRFIQIEQSHPRVWGWGTAA